jgi:23S rRNA (pseudouridine1915-N3)-methyltransferase
MKFHLIAVGALKKGAHHDLFTDYQKRLRATLVVKELATDTPERERADLLAAINPKIPIIALDERGQDLSSAAFANLIQGHFTKGDNSLQFIIGGADGLDDSLRARAHHIIRFGSATWPHMLVRVMLAEQLYRAETIMSGHPYHRG